MKTWILLTAAVIGLLTGCRTTPAKLLAASSVTVDKAMKAWAVYVVDGHATQGQIISVKQAQRDYYAAEDLAIEALVAYERGGSKENWQAAFAIFAENEQNLINLVACFTGKAL